MKPIHISPFKRKYSNSFFELNSAWITEFWELENSDFNILLSPEKFILERGGEVFFLVLKSRPIGTVAMIRHEKGVYELAKMTVEKSFRGRGYSKLLLAASIDFAKEKSAHLIFLISNRKLKVARQLYDSYGFKEVNLDSSEYHRGDVKMELVF